MNCLFTNTKKKPETEDSRKYYTKIKLMTPAFEIQPNADYSCASPFSSSHSLVRCCNWNLYRRIKKWLRSIKIVEWWSLGNLFWLNSKMEPTKSVVCSKIIHSIGYFVLVSIENVNLLYTVYNVQHSLLNKYNVEQNWGHFGIPLQNAFSIPGLVAGEINGTDRYPKWTDSWSYRMHSIFKQTKFIRHCTNRRSASNLKSIRSVHIRAILPLNM